MLSADMYEYLKDYIDFRHKGLFSREVSLDYKAVSEQPWLFFNCLSDDNFSFRAHDLELGNKEAIFWHVAAQRNKEIKFTGFVNRIIRDMRGYLTIPDIYHELGIQVGSGRVYKVRTQEEIDDSRDELFTYISHVIVQNEEIENKIED